MIPEMRWVADAANEAAQAEPSYRRSPWLAYAFAARSPALSEAARLQCRVVSETLLAMSSVTPPPIGALLVITSVI